jgi:hypothetical protein
MRKRVIEGVASGVSRHGRQDRSEHSGQSVIRALATAISLPPARIFSAIRVISPSLTRLAIKLASKPPALSLCRAVMAGGREHSENVALGLPSLRP